MNGTIERPAPIHVPLYEVVDFPSPCKKEEKTFFHYDASTERAYYISKRKLNKQ